MVMMGAIMSGISKSMEDTERRRTSELERKVRQAQIDKLMQDIAYQQQMQPLEMDAKRGDIAFRGAQTRQTEQEIELNPKKVRAQIASEEALTKQRMTQIASAEQEARDKAEYAKAYPTSQRAQDEAAAARTKLDSMKQDMKVQLANLAISQAQLADQQKRTAIAGRKSGEESVLETVTSEIMSGNPGISKAAALLAATQQLAQARSVREEPMVDLSQGQPRETTGGSEGHPLVKEFSKRIGGMKLEQPWLFSLSPEQEKQGMQNLTRGELKTLTPAIAAGLVSADQVIEDPAFMGAIRATEPQTYDALQQLLAERSRLEQQPKKVPASRAQDAAAAMADAERKTREINLKIRTLLQGLGK